MRTGGWFPLGRKPASQQDRYASKLDELKDAVGTIDGLKRKMADDLLETYVQVYADYVTLNNRLMRDGLLHSVEKGAANNRHTEYVKHPAFDMRRNCITQMADLSAKIWRFVKDGDVQEDDADGFGSF